MKNFQEVELSLEALGEDPEILFDSLADFASSNNKHRASRLFNEKGREIALRIESAETSANILNNLEHTIQDFFQKIEHNCTTIQEVKEQISTFAASIFESYNGEDCDLEFDEENISNALEEIK